VAYEHEVEGMAVWWELRRRRGLTGQLRAQRLKQPVVNKRKLNPVPRAGLIAQAKP